MWDFVDSSNKMLDPSVETVLKNFPVLRLLPGKFSRFYKDALKCRDAIIQRFYEDFKVSALADPESTRSEDVKLR